MRVPLFKCKEIASRFDYLQSVATVLEDKYNYHTKYAFFQINSDLTENLQKIGNSVSEKNAHGAFLLPPAEIADNFIAFKNVAFCDKFILLI